MNNKVMGIIFATFLLIMPKIICEDGLPDDEPDRTQSKNTLPEISSGESDAITDKKSVKLKSIDVKGNQSAPENDGLEDGEVQVNYSFIKVRTEWKEKIIQSADYLP